MSKQIINTEKAPKAIGPYVQAIKADKLLFVSGQIPLDPVTMQKDGNDIKTQTKRVLENIKAIISQANGKMEDIVRCTVYLKDINDFAAMNEVYGQYFSNWKPTRCAIAVANLPKDVLVEIEATAYIG